MWANYIDQEMIGKIMACVMLEWQEVGGANLNKCMDGLVSYGENVESCIPRVPKKPDTATKPSSIEGRANIFYLLAGYASFHNNNNLRVYVCG